MLNINQYSSYDKLSLKSAQFVFEKIQKQIIATGKCNLGLATGKSPKGMYKALIDLLSKSKLDLSNFHTFNLDEYFPIWQNHKNSYFQEMYNSFWKPLHALNPTFEIPNGHILNGETRTPDLECRIYEKMIQKRGGIDIQVLGLGINGHIGFNEPGSEGASRTRVVDLTTATRETNMVCFDNDPEKVPAQGLTMGIGTILEARDIVLIAT